MGFGKASARFKPTALGTLQQASTYGTTIQTILGCARSTPSPIWAAHLRQGHSSKKKKGKKGAPPSYVENIDMILGSAPIGNVLQIWSNSNNAYRLNFVKLRIQPTGGIGANSLAVTMTDPHFFFPVAITMEVQVLANTLTFNDYGGPGSQTVPASPTIFELPLWNGVQHGPDLADPNHSRFPYYLWTPSDGAVINFPSVRSWFAPILYGYPGIWTTFVNIYYAQTTSKLKFESPLQFNRFTFEAELGSGTEYADAGLSSQQILYPQFAGVGSSNMDLGSAGLIPSWRFETWGSYGFMPPRGDAEFADMVEDIIKSGAIQLGASIGSVQRGCNCVDRPGPVQKNYLAIGSGASTITFTQANKAGNTLIAAARFAGGSGVGISDTAGNTWNSVWASATKGIWYSNPCLASPPRNAVSFSSGSSTDEYWAILEMDEVLSIDSTATASTSVGSGFVTASITTTGDVDYIVAIALNGLFEPIPTLIPPALWTNLLPLATQGYGLVCGRKVSAPGTYTFTQQNGATGELAIALIALKVNKVAPYPKALGNIIDFDSLMNVRLQCRTGGLQGSLVMDSARPGADWLAEIYQSMNAAPVWSGFSLKSIARSEVSALGQGCVYFAPTANGPVANLTESDLVEGTDGTMITVERKAQVDALNILQVQHFDRSNDYNQATTSQPESGSIAQYGPRKQSPTVLNMIQDPAVARKVLSIEVRRNAYLRNVYKFKPKAKWLILEAMDLITVTDSKIGINALPVRLTKITENADFGLEAEAEPYIYGVHALDDLTVTTLAPFAPDMQAVPALVNAPVILEPVPLLYHSANQRELWIVVSDSDPIYGGCFVYISTDGGSSYNLVPDQDGTILGNGTTGVVTTDWPASTDPDTTNDLLLDLSESLGTLLSYQVADEDAFTYPCYVAGASLVNDQTGATSYTIVNGDSGKCIGFASSSAIAVTLPSGLVSMQFSIANRGPSTVTVTASGGTINGNPTVAIPANTALFFTYVSPNATTSPNTTLTMLFWFTLYFLEFGASSVTQYELMTYAVATLTSTNHYTLKATGGGGNHLRRAVFGAPSAGQGVDHQIGSRFAFLNPSGVGMMKMVMDPQWVGTTLHFKFLGFNNFLAGVQDITTVVDYTYTPTGAGGAVNPSGTPVQSQIFLVNGT